MRKWKPFVKVEFLLVFLMLMGCYASVTATTLELDLDREKYASIRFTHEDKDQAGSSQGAGIGYESPFPYVQSNEHQDLSDTSPNPVNLTLNANLDGIDSNLQPSATAAASDTGNPAPSDHVTIRMDANINGLSQYGISGLSPKHGWGSDQPDPNPPNPDDFDYYNNWEYTTVESFIYSDLNDKSNGTFLRISDDGDVNIGEQFEVSATFSWGFDLNGMWAYKENTDGQTTFDERSGHFYTYFQSSLGIRDEFGNTIWGQFQTPDDPSTPDVNESDANPIVNEVLVRDNFIDTNLFPNGQVTQNANGQGSMTFSFTATEDVEYNFWMWTALYGAADGIASFDSMGWVELDLKIIQQVGDGTPVEPGEVPEPATILLMGAGLLIGCVFRRRIGK